VNVIEKYNARAETINSLLCVGLDTDFERLPERFRRLESPQYAFNRMIIDQTQPYAAAFKINTAFYEVRGAAGWLDLQRTIQYLRDSYPTILTIADAKRGDIGNTSHTYARAIFDELGFDSVTLHPYLGHEAISPFLSRADKGCIILCRTSNTGAGELQDLTVEGKPLWAVVAEKVNHQWNTNGNCMLVVGATYPQEIRQIRQLVGDMTLLIPGIGAQGGEIEAVMRAGINKSGKGVIVNASRSIIYADDPAHAALDLRNTINHYRDLSVKYDA
jgi:orotidine-5'-phosphate decarboxylase